jgi:GNAT superfamily N-acetyltransferase
MPRAMPPRAPRPRIEIVPHAPEDLRREVSGRLDMFNVATTGFAEWHSVTAVLRDQDEQIVGGLLAEIWATWLHVSYLWVAAPYRGHGHGGDLLRAAERFAVARGCRAARLETYSFQAPGFYAKLGYEVFGVLDDCPPGHQHFFLRRTLAGDTRRASSKSGRAPRG